MVPSTRLQARADRYGDLADAYLAVSAGIAWNTVYEARHDRVVSTVGRLWNREYGGVALFGWDNFFLAYMTSLDDRELALANVIEHLRGATARGFPPQRQPGQRQQVLGPFTTSGGRDHGAGGVPPISRALVPGSRLRSAAGMESLVAAEAAQ